MGGTCSMCGIVEIGNKISPTNLEVKIHLGRLSVDGRIILKLVLIK
jgi:hypothetical protein